MNNLPPLPCQMKKNPFGMDETGKLIKERDGKTMLGSVRYMLQFIDERERNQALSGVSQTELSARIEQAKSNALNVLIERLNAAIANPRYHITPDYLMNEWHYYTAEMTYYTYHICADICADPRFHFHAGTKIVPTSFIHLIRPFPIRKVYEISPQLSQKFGNIELACTYSDHNLARIRWYPRSMLELIPPELYPIGLHITCQSLQGLYAEVPHGHSDLPQAQIKELSCACNGDEYCEWEFGWEEHAKRGLFDWFKK